MLEIKNNTPLNVELVPGLDKNGYDYAIIIIKAKFNILPNNKVLKLSDEPAKVCRGDEYYDEPGKSSIRFGSDVSLFKRSTDIVLNGQAYAPNNRSKPVLDVCVEFANQKKTCRVFGERRWEKSGSNWQYSSPTHFERMSLKYENSYGGTFEKKTDSAVHTYAKTNPIGKGYVDPESNGPKQDQVLPNLEDPRSLIQHWKDQPPLAGYGFVSPDWQPRLQLSGTYDDLWQKSRMPLLPQDFDEGFFNSAHPDMIANTALTGGETFRLKNLTESGQLEFQLPSWNLPVEASIKGKSSLYSPNLDTVVIEPDLHSVYLSWRTTIPCYRQFLLVDSLTVGKKRAA